MALITSGSAQPEPSESAGSGRVTPPSLEAEGYPAFRDYPVPALAATTAAPAPPALMLAGQWEQLAGDAAPPAAPSTSPSPAGGPASRSAPTPIARGEENTAASRPSSPPAETPPDSAPSSAPRAAGASPSAGPKPAGSTPPSTAPRSDDAPREGADPPARTPAEPSAPEPTEPSTPEPTEPSTPDEPAEPSTPDEPAGPPRAIDDLTDHLAALVAAWAERPPSPVGREALWDESVRAGLWWAVVETCNEDHPDLIADCLGVADEIVAEMELSPVEPARWTKLMAEGRDAGYRLALAAMERLEARPDPEPDAPAELPTLPSGPLLPLP